MWLGKSHPSVGAKVQKLSAKLGRKTGYVLPRITEALSQFIAPVSSSKRVAVHPSPAAGDFERHPSQRQATPKKQESAPQKEPLAPVVPLRKEEKTAPPSVTHAFVQIVALFSQQKAVLVRWLGRKSYEAAASGQKKSGKIKHGAILDRKAE